MRDWYRFFDQLQRDARLWLLFFGGLSVCRLVCLFALREHASVTWDAPNVVRACVTGWRFDSMVATYWVFPTFVLSWLCQWANLARWNNMMRSCLAMAYLVITPVLCFATVEFYKEFHDGLNESVFRFYYDDMGATTLTIVREYGAVPYLLLSGMVVAVGGWFQRWWLSRALVSRRFSTLHVHTWPRQTAVAVTVLVVFVFGMRGSLGRRPAQLKQASVTSSRLLNKMVVNPYYALRTATKRHLAVRGESGLHDIMPSHTLPAAVSTVFPDRAAAATDLTQVLAHQDESDPAVRPRHIFLIIMESYDAWPLMERYRSLGLVPEGRRLARQGLHFPAFLPAAAASMSSYSAIVTGIPHADLQVHLSATSGQAYETSLPDTMRRLGYRTRFFCGGFLSWSNIGDFARRQGFQEVYGAGHIQGKRGGNEWGAADEDLFDYVQEHVSDSEPSFNVIQTSSYHPPYSLDPKALGFPLRQVPPDLRDEFEFEPDERLHVYGHLWYSDRELGRFVRTTAERHEAALFAITGDHYGRKFLNAHPTLYERSAVPLILYGPQVLAPLRNQVAPDEVAGSHIDIGPTLIELSAPRGFRYFAFGKNLLNPRPEKAAEPTLAIGWDVVMTPDFIINVRDDNQVSPLPERNLPPLQVDRDRYVRYFQALRGLAWWRVKSGTELPAFTETELPDERPAAQMAGRPPTTYPTRLQRR